MCFSSHLPRLEITREDFVGKIRIEYDGSLVLFREVGMIGEK